MASSQRHHPAATSTTVFFLLAAVVGASSAMTDDAATTTLAPKCTFQPMDCTDNLTPPGFLRSWGTDLAAQQRCCSMCANNTACAVAVLATDQGGVCMLKSHTATCKKMAAHAKRVGCLPAGKPAPPLRPSPSPSPPGPKNNAPTWKVTYNMSESTVVMPCNYTGLYDYEAYPHLAQFGLVPRKCLKLHGHLSLSRAQR
jgi:hypothetical protein|eukprot:COSAG01_NODE_2218_length_8146_cov_7.810015_9_plen_199_part_00